VLWISVFPWFSGLFVPANTLISIDRGDVGIRVDRVLLRHLTHVRGASRNRIQRLIAEGGVHLNGQPVTRSSVRVAAGDSLSIDLPDRKPRSRPQAEALPLHILFEDTDLLVVNKPAGQVSHPAFRNTSGTLLNALLAHAGGAWTPALLSRLDKDTSGIVLVAKNAAVQARLQRIAQQNGIEKDYLAIVYGKPPAKGTIDHALDRDPWDHRRVTVRDRGGVPSVTKFERLRSAAIGGGEALSLMRCRLITGRTHQIRVHLSSKGWPIVGDSVYGRRHAGTRETAPIERQALHAWRVAFAQPSTGAWMEVTAPIPADMQALLQSAAMGDYFTRARSSSTVARAE
jgi:23S rRNA pseudouridine1911/1915/1917 synthase